MRTQLSALIVGAGLLCGTAAHAQQGAPSKTETDKTEKKVEEFRIVAIDRPDRILTVMGNENRLHVVRYRQAVPGLEELKLGDKVTFATEELMVTAVFPARESGLRPAPAAGAPMTAGAPAAPGAAATPAPAELTSLMGPTVTVIVTLSAVDAATPAVTFSTPDGRTQTLKLMDARMAPGLKVGDRVELTYAPALTLHVEQDKAAKSK